MRGFDVPSTVLARGALQRAFDRDPDALRCHFHLQYLHICQIQGDRDLRLAHSLALTSSFSLAYPHP